MFEMKSMFEVGKPSSRYIRITWMLSSQAALNFPDLSRIRFFSTEEANSLANQLRKRNVFARHEKESNFYVQRIRKLAQHTVIEVVRPGAPKDIAEEAERVAAILERLTVLSSTLALTKDELLRKLGVSSKPGTEIDFIFGPDFYYLSSKSRPFPTVQCIKIDKRFCTRFLRCGFDKLTEYCLSGGGIRDRVLLSLDWLFESRIEPRLTASVVKTSIALESMLIFSESESLSQSLSERTAFILSSDPDRRQQISRIIKRFYEVRSGIVHGSQKKMKNLEPSLLEAVDRLTILLCLIIAANSRRWPSVDDLKNWCETQRWGKPSNEVKVPFPAPYLSRAIALVK
jgi:hypothetical protein